jgi:hypothetical protein
LALFAQQLRRGVQITDAALGVHAAEVFDELQIELRGAQTRRDVRHLVHAAVGDRLPLKNL